MSIRTRKFFKSLSRYAVVEEEDIQKE